ncbi:MAG: AAA family ATPase [Dehalococcoidia bacterium]|nr:AAA family ATPase [Dehalococcoidia bacterium]
MGRRTLPSLIRRMLEPTAYPHPVDRVELHQTHISFVLLAGEYAYKIKKPVNFGFLDFSTLKKLIYYSQEEVRLNNRLCQYFNLQVVPIVESDGKAAIGRQGRTLEYAVQMRRLPHERMMDRLLALGEFSENMVDRIASRLVRFHEQSATNAEIARYGDLAIRSSWRENFRQWRSAIGHTLSKQQDHLLQRYVRSFLRRHQDLLTKRVKERRIRDCHGDLRSDAICFGKDDEVLVYDCIEFNRRFRYTDVAGDIGFLAMDLDYRGHQDFSEELVKRYVQLSGDSDVPIIINFYKCYRAAVRGKVEGLRLAQTETSAKEKRQALSAARRYFRLACRYAGHDTPWLFIMCGLPGTGKSTLAHRMAGELNLALYSSDIVRKEIHGLGPEEHRSGPWRDGIYSQESTEQTYRVLLERASRRLGEGTSAIIDASFLSRRHRRWARRLAQEQDAAFLCLQLRTPETIAQRRLHTRSRDVSNPSDADWEIYRDKQRSQQPPDELPEEELLTIQSDRSMGQQLKTLRGFAPDALRDVLTSQSIEDTVREQASSLGGSAKEE